MFSVLYSIIGFILAIGVLVAVHEFGHFWVARKLGVKVLTFSIGFGKPIWRKVAGPDQTEYVIARIPLGGYVKMLGEGSQSDPVSASEAHRAFDNQPIWKRTLIVAAGPGINFLFAILVFMLVGLKSFEQIVPVFGDVPKQSVLAQSGVKPGDTLLTVNGKHVNFLAEHDIYIFNQVLKREAIELGIESNGRQSTVSIPTADMPIYRINPSSLMRQLGFASLARPIDNSIEEVQKGSAAEKAGLLKGDRFISIDNTPINNWNDLVKIVQPSAGKALPVIVERDGREVAVTVTPIEKKIGDRRIGLFGVTRVFVPYPPEQIVSISRGPLEALEYGASQTWLMSTLTLRMLWKMVTLQVSYKNVNGPLMIADVAGQAIQIGLTTYLYFLALISISLGVMNLLPIPMLDGGHLATYVVELFAGKKVADRAFIAAQPFGLLMLACLMSLAFYNDILKIFN